MSNHKFVQLDHFQSIVAFMASINGAPFTQLYIEKYNLNIDPPETSSFKYLEKFLDCGSANDVFKIILEYISKTGRFLSLKLINGRQTGQLEASVGTEINEKSLTIRITRGSFKKADYRLLSTGLQKVMVEMNLPDPINPQIILDSCLKSWRN